jgi:hypothetical protein
MAKQLHPIIAAITGPATDNLFYEHLLPLLESVTEPLQEADLPKDLANWSDDLVDRMIAAAGHSSEGFRERLKAVLASHESHSIQMALDEI